MRKIREVLRLKHDCRLSCREIAHSCGIARSTVSDYLNRAARAGLSWPLPSPLTEEDLEARLFCRPVTDGRPRPAPDYAFIEEELRLHRSVNLTLDLLWREYKEQHPEGYQYTQFVAHDHRWRRQRDLCLRQVHRYGEKVFVDFAEGLALIDAQTGTPMPTALFVAVWGASNYTYAEACPAQDLPSWLGAHVRALEYFQCVPQILVPDNLRAGVTKACRYEPELNPTCADLASHYRVAIVPTRVRKPRDKAKAETGVLIVKRWVLAALRHRRFASLGELNAAIRPLLERLNTRPLRQLQRSRRELFEAWDWPAARALPVTPYEYAEWRHATVNIDYHIAVDHHLLQRAVSVGP
jgi:transposase